MQFKLRIRNASQIVCVSISHQKFKRGNDMRQLHILQNATVVIDMSGRIYAIDTEAAMLCNEWYQTATFVNDIDGIGKSIIPGLVDAHSHPIWAGDRVHEFSMKLAGATYMDIHQAGGGIEFTVNHTRNSTSAYLEQLLNSRLKRCLSHGTTLLEAKSGYGLDIKTEMNLLRILHKVSHEQPLKIVSTYLGAHSIPKGFTAAEAAKDIIDNHIPRILELKDKNEIDPRFIDVFYEKGIFERAETLSIMIAGKKAGMKINFHGDELHPMGAAELGAEMMVHAISHLEEVSETGIRLMAEKDIFAVLLPTTAYLLRINPPPARKMIENDVIVALGSDFNPNAHCLSMPFVMNLACVLLKMTMEEALVAATLNAAASLDKSGDHGSIEVGKCANFVVIDHPRWEHIIYEMVDPPIEKVIVEGDVVYTK